jgi:hypothetical protein
MLKQCWQISFLPTRNSVTIRYWGPTPTDALVASLKELEEALPRTPVVLVIDIRELEGNNPESRELWQAFLREHRSTLKTVYVVSLSSSIFYRMLASVLSLGAGVRLCLVESPSEIP